MASECASRTLLDKYEELTDELKQHAIFEFQKTIKEIAELKQESPTLSNFELINTASFYPEEQLCKWYEEEKKTIHCMQQLKVQAKTILSRLTIILSVEEVQELLPIPTLDVEEKRLQQWHDTLYPLLKTRLCAIAAELESCCLFYFNHKNLDALKDLEDSMEKFNSLLEHIRSETNELKIGETSGVYLRFFIFLHRHFNTYDLNAILESTEKPSLPVELQDCEDLYNTLWPQIQIQDLTLIPATSTHQPFATTKSVDDWFDAEKLDDEFLNQVYLDCFKPVLELLKKEENLAQTHPFRLFERNIRNATNKAEILLSMLRTMLEPIQTYVEAKNFSLKANLDCATALFEHIRYFQKQDGGGDTPEYRQLKVRSNPVSDCFIQTAIAFSIVLYFVRAAQHHGFYAAPKPTRSHITSHHVRKNAQKLMIELQRKINL